MHFSNLLDSVKLSSKVLITTLISSVKWFSVSHIFANIDIISSLQIVWIWLYLSVVLMGNHWNPNYLGYWAFFMFIIHSTFLNTFIFLAKHSLREMSWPDISLSLFSFWLPTCLHLLSAIMSPLRVGIYNDETILKTTQWKCQITST